MKTGEVKSEGNGRRYRKCEKNVGKILRKKCEVLLNVNSNTGGSDA
jgi:hypothetical protein